MNDEERKEAFRSLIAQKEALVPQGPREWLCQQVIRFDQYDKCTARLDHKRIISTLADAEKFFASDSTSSSHISDVLTPEQQYIVCGYPSHESAFWKRIIDSDIQTVVALITPRREPYWVDNRYPKVVDGCTVTKISEEIIGTSPFFVQHRIIWRTFSISRQDSSTQIVQHFHYENWPDHDAPEDTLFRRFLQLIESQHTDGSKPILVHCAGGVGRSGTFVAAHSLRKEVRKLDRRDGPHFVNVPKRILELRMQRARMIGHTSQLVAVIEAVRDAVFQDYLSQPER